MVPTYFRRELRDRVLQRRSRLRTSLRRHTPRKRGIQYAAPFRYKLWSLWNTGSPAP